ncbi:MAG: mechanosensitive ion channel family protein [Anaerolineae bacterium]
MNFINQIPFLRELPVQQQALIVIILAPILVWVVATLIRTIVLRFIMVPIRHYSKRTETNLDDRALAVIERPLRVLLIGIAIAIISVLVELGGDLNQLANSISNALIITAIFFFIYNLVDVIGVTSDNLKNFLGIHIEDRLLPFLRVVTKVFIVVMGLLIVVQEFGYSIAGLIASFGVIGLAISLAAQDTAANVIGFTSIVSDNPFQVGDYIVTNSNIAGTVDTVGVRTTRIRKLDQSLVTIPNSKLTSDALTNWSRLAKRRLDFYIGLTYSTTASQMRELLERLREMLRARETIDAESVVVHFVEFADSALNIRIVAYVMIADWAEFTAEQELVNLEIMEIVESLGLSMAFPSRSLYVESYPKADKAPTQAMPEPTPEPTQAPAPTGKSENTYQDNPTVSSDGDGDGDEGR